MYRCEEHGEMVTDWCDECQTLLKCDHTNLETERFRSLEYGDESWTATIYLTFCTTCGEKHDVSFLPHTTPNPKPPAARKSAGASTDEHPTF